MLCLLDLAGHLTTLTNGWDSADGLAWKFEREGNMVYGSRKWLYPQLVGGKSTREASGRF